MVDKGLQILVMAIFTVLGIAILVLAWAQQMPLGERILVTFVSLVGFSWVIARTILMKSAEAKSNLKNPTQTE